MSSDRTIVRFRGRTVNVTAVCGTQLVELVKALSASKVIDYR